MHKPEKLILHFLTSSLHIFFPPTPPTKVTSSCPSSLTHWLDFFFVSPTTAFLFALVLLPANLITSWTFIPKVLTFSPLQLHNPRTWQRKPYFMSFTPESHSLQKSKWNFTHNSTVFLKVFFWTPLIVTWLVPDQFSVSFSFPCFLLRSKQGKLKFT